MDRQHNDEANIDKGKSEAVNKIWTDNTMTKRTLIKGNQKL